MAALLPGCQETGHSAFPTNLVIPVLAVRALTPGHPVRSEYSHGGLIRFRITGRRVRFWRATRSCRTAITFFTGEALWAGQLVR